mmetsp:Transcript_20723/g.43370  ORF Transcript_20723/g.43370 Transcript_20723/m.43370 type:complete len:377 (-) Transcript_20723:25-1155(-)
MNDTIGQYLGSTQRRSTLLAVLTAACLSVNGCAQAFVPPSVVLADRASRLLQPQGKKSIVRSSTTLPSNEDGSVAALYSPPASEIASHDEPTPSLPPPMPSQHFHEFWSQDNLSHQSIQNHVEYCLDLVETGEAAVPTSAQSQDEPRIQIISTEPPLLVIHDFLSKPMCQEIIQAAQDTGEMKRSTTGNQKTTSGTRTSSTVWLQDGHCPAPLRLLADKVSLLSGLPPSHMENLQVCRYLEGQQFNLHTDHQESFNELDCRGRLATCLIYLAEPEQGGETWFPDVLQPPTSTSSQPNYEVLVPAQRGSAVFFWNTVERPGQEDYTPLMDLRVEERLMHAGLPVQKGEKWICNRWIHPIDFESGVVGLSGPPKTALE